MRRENWKHIFVIWRVKITFPPPADQFQVWTSDALSSHLTLTSELQLFRQFESKEVCIKNSYPPEIRVRICLLCVLLKSKTYIKLNFHKVQLFTRVTYWSFNDCCKKNGKCLASYFIHHDGSSVAHIAVNCSTHHDQNPIAFKLYSEFYTMPHKAYSAHVVRPGFLIVGTPSPFSHHLLAAVAKPGRATLFRSWFG